MDNIPHLEDSDVIYNNIAVANRRRKVLIGTVVVISGVLLINAIIYYFRQ